MVNTVAARGRENKRPGAGSAQRTPDPLSSTQTLPPQITNTRGKAPSGRPGEGPLTLLYGRGCDPGGLQEAHQNVNQHDDNDKPYQNAYYLVHFFSSSRPLGSLAIVIDSYDLPAITSREPTTDRHHRHQTTLSARVWSRKGIGRRHDPLRRALL
jgi:hypothetical protein